MNYSDIITIEPEMRSGIPCIREMRITFSDILSYLASGMAVDEVLTNFSELTPEEIRTCLAFAAAQEDHLTSIKN